MRKHLAKVGFILLAICIALILATYITSCYWLFILAMPVWVLSFISIVSYVENDNKENDTKEDNKGEV